MKRSFFTNLILLLSIMVTIQSCNDEDFPAVENEEEFIDNVRLTFTSADEQLVFEAFDEDGQGAGSFIIPSIELKNNTNYVLSIELENTLTGDEITSEVSEEGDEHLFFYEWTEGLFVNPTGNGNADNRNDVVNYIDNDLDGLPIGLITEWNTSEITTSSSKFRIVLKHQPNVKTSTSTIMDGETDLDITWPIIIN